MGARGADPSRGIKSLSPALVRARKAVAQISKSAVSQVSKPAGGRKPMPRARILPPPYRTPAAVWAPADLEVGDTADLEVCATAARLRPAPPSRHPPPRHLTHMNASLRLSLAALLSSWPPAPPARPRAERPDLRPLDDQHPGRVDEIFARQERAQFGSNRFALLFQPGSYHLDVQVGFYTEVAGLGRSPDDAAITGAVRSKAAGWGTRMPPAISGARCANLSVTPPWNRT